MKKILGLLTALLFVSPVMGETALYCQDIAGGGVFKGDDGQWRDGSFKSRRHTLLLSDDRRTLQRSGIEYDCEQKETSEGNFYLCRNHFKVPNIIVLSSDLSRFQYTQNSPYAYVLDGTDTSAIAIGNCEKFLNWKKPNSTTTP